MPLGLIHASGWLDVGSRTNRAVAMAASMSGSPPRVRGSMARSRSWVPSGDDNGCLAGTHVDRLSADFDDRISVLSHCGQRVWQRRSGVGEHLIGAIATHSFHPVDEGRGSAGFRPGPVIRSTAAWFGVTIATPSRSWVRSEDHVVGDSGELLVHAGVDFTKAEPMRDQTGQICINC